MTTDILSRDTIHVDDVDVTLFVVHDTALSGPFSVTALAPDGRRFVAVSEDTDDATINRCVAEVARSTFSSGGWVYVPTDYRAVPHDASECVHCGEPIRRADERAFSGDWATVWADQYGTWVCPETGDEHEPKHAHSYRSDVGAWWCTDCNTNTDYCQQLNPS